MRLPLKLAAACLALLPLVGCGSEEAKPKPEVKAATTAANLPTTPSKKRAPKPSLEASRKQMNTGAIAD